MTSPSTGSPARELTIPRGSDPVPTHSRLHTRRIPVVLYVAVLLLVPGLVVAGFISAGLWATTGKAATAQAGAPRDQAGTGAVVPADPADVKGSMTVQQVLDAFPSITATQLLAEFGAPLDTPISTQLKALVEGGSGTDLPAIRLWLEKQMGHG